MLPLTKCPALLGPEGLIVGLLSAVWKGTTADSHPRADAVPSEALSGRRFPDPYESPRLHQVSHEWIVVGRSSFLSVIMGS